MATENQLIETNQWLYDWGFWGLVVAVIAFFYARSDNILNKINYWQTQLQDDAELRRETAAKLRGHSLGAAYQYALQRALAWLDRQFGAAGSMQALEVCILIAVAYAYASFFLGFTITGSGDIGGLEFIKRTALTENERAIISLISIVLPCLGFYLARWLAQLANRLERQMKSQLLRYWRRLNLKRQTFDWTYRLVLGLLVILALLGFGQLEIKGAQAIIGFLLLFSLPLLGGVISSTIASRLVSQQWQGNIGFLLGIISGAVVLVAPVTIIVTFGEASTLILALALALVLVLVLVLVFAGVLAFVAAGVAALIVTFVLYLAVCVPLVLVFAVAFAKVEAVAGFLPLPFIVATTIGVLVGTIRNHNSIRNLLAGCLGGLVAIGVFAAYFSSAHMWDILTVFLLLFFLVLPIANGIFDWLSWWATRALGRQLLGTAWRICCLPWPCCWVWRIAWRLVLPAITNSPKCSTACSNYVQPSPRPPLHRGLMVFG